MEFTRSCECTREERVDITRTRDQVVALIDGALCLSRTVLAIRVAATVHPPNDRCDGRGSDLHPVWQLLDGYDHDVAAQVVDDVVARFPNGAIGGLPIPEDFTAGGATVYTELLCFGQDAFLNWNIAPPVSRERAGDYALSIRTRGTDPRIPGLLRTLLAANVDFAFAQLRDLDGRARRWEPVDLVEHLQAFVDSLADLPAA